MFSAYVGEVFISDPTLVTTKLATTGNVYDSGGVFCTCPELGFEGADLIYCRYGLSLPYYKVKDGDKVWIKPTIDDDERWIYFGFVDCGRSSVTPITGTQAIIENEDGTFNINVGTTMEIAIDSILGKLGITAGTLSIDIDSVLSTLDVIAGATCKIEMDATTNLIKLTAGSNTIKIDGTAGKIQLNGANLEVLV